MTFITLYCFHSCRPVSKHSWQYVFAMTRGLTCCLKCTTCSISSNVIVSSQRSSCHIIPVTFSEWEQWSSETDCAKRRNCCLLQVTISSCLKDTVFDLTYAR